MFPSVDLCCVIFGTLLGTYVCAKQLFVLDLKFKFYQLSHISVGSPGHPTGCKRVLQRTAGSRLIRRRAFSAAGGEATAGPPGGPSGQWSLGQAHGSSGPLPRDPAIPTTPSLPCFPSFLPDTGPAGPCPHGQLKAGKGSPSLHSMWPHGGLAQGSGPQLCSRPSWGGLAGRRPAPSRLPKVQNQAVQSQGTALASPSVGVGFWLCPSSPAGSVLRPGRAAASPHCVTSV